MTKEELLKTKCQHELCLIELLEHFEELEKKVDSRYLKQHFRGLQDNLRKYLNLESKGEVNE